MASANLQVALDILPTAIIIEVSLIFGPVIAEVLSKFGSGLFLLVQVVMLLDFTNNWNDSWVEKDEQKW